MANGLINLVTLHILCAFLQGRFPVQSYCKPEAVKAMGNISSCTNNAFKCSVTIPKMLSKIFSEVANNFRFRKESKHIYVSLGYILLNGDVTRFIQQLSRIHLPVNDSLLRSLSSFAYIKSGNKLSGPIFKTCSV